MVISTALVVGVQRSYVVCRPCIIANRFYPEAEVFPELVSRDY